MNYGPTETILMALHGLLGTGIIATGITALLSPKGGRMHRTSGKIFVLVFCLMGLVIAASVVAANGLISALGIIYTALIIYLVLTSWATVKTPPSTLSRLNYVAPPVAMAIGSLALFWGWQTQTGRLQLADDIPVGAFFAFSALAFLTAYGDFAIVRLGGIAGTKRLIRHLWRMCLALYFSVSTLFTGPGSVVFPDAIRGSWPLMIPELSIMALTIYFIIRLIRADRIAKLRRSGHLC